MIEQNFTRKKVKSLTLGEKLRQLREERRMRVHDLSRKINVKNAYIEALEKGQYNKLPTKVYVKGFVRSYARFFGVTEHILLNLFEREYSVYNNINHKDKEEEVNKLPDVPRFVFTPRILAAAIAFVLLIAIGVYLYFGIDNFLSSPWLVINNPAQNSVVETETVIVEGETRSNSRVFINGQQVFVNMDGTFSENVGLSQGVNTIQIKSVNKFNKESVAYAVVDAQYLVEEPEKEEPPHIKIFVRTTSDAVLLNVSADNVSVYSDVPAKDEVKEFDGEELIAITTSDGSKTYVSCDGEDYIRMGEKGEIVKNRMFDRQHMCVTEGEGRDDRTSDETKK